MYQRLNSLNENQIYYHFSFHTQSKFSTLLIDLNAHFLDFVNLCVSLGLFKNIAFAFQDGW